MAHEGFDVSLGRHLISGLVHHTRPIWRWLGGLETKLLADRLAEVEIEAPIYIAGLARTGSTILLRIVSSHPDCTSHQYRDFPFLFVPHWWQQTLERQVRGQLEPAERAHEDRLKVTPESPEAMEEVLWMAFFDELHDPDTSNVLDAETNHPDFAEFYRNHIRKLLHARGGERYLAKGNYNVTRLEFLLETFPDARFLVPVRHPIAHVASSRKQHRLFCRGCEAHPRAEAHLKWVGHFEFGPHRRPINAGDDETVASIERLWDEGREVRGWARYWAHLYGYLAERLEANDALAEATYVVRYEDLCGETRSEIDELMEFCRLDNGADSIAERFAETVTRPSYYDQDFDDEQRRAIAEETREVAARFDYTDLDAEPPETPSSATRPRSGDR